MKNIQDNTKEKFVVLRGIQHNNVFFTTNTPGSDPTKSEKGETWYEVLGYTDTVEEAQALIAAHNIKMYVLAARSLTSGRIQIGILTI